MHVLLVREKTNSSASVSAFSSSVRPCRISTKRALDSSPSGCLQRQTLLNQLVSPSACPETHILLEELHVSCQSCLVLLRGCGSCMGPEVRGVSTYDTEAPTL